MFKFIDDLRTKATKGLWYLSGQYRIMGSRPGWHKNADSVARVRAHQEYRDPEEDAANARLIVVHQNLFPLMQEVALASIAYRSSVCICPRHLPPYGCKPTCDCCLKGEALDKLLKQLEVAISNLDTKKKGKR